MSLPEDYLRYPLRRRGMDQDRYEWRPRADAPRRAWPNGAKVAACIVAPLEFHMLNPSGKPFKHPGAMQTPYPDLRHYTTRDYGVRVGAFRLLDALKRHRVRITFAVNAVLLTRAAPLIEAITADGHEIAAYGWDTDTLHWGGLVETEEAARVDKVRAAFAAAGLAPRAWLSPARSQSFATPDIVRAAGFDICLDWEMDNTPVAMRTAAGLLHCVPLSNELDDRKLLIDQRQTEEEWRAQILEANALLQSEHDRFGGQTLAFTLTPYVIGQPFRIWALDALLSALATDDAVWTATASELVEACA
ncbi:MAG: polysaccharide deacetylase family protein [Alphaproteobacteria bacterium]|nr:polysaccharide deacetylase family protein [Alphaproteobacteria bacterium]